MKISKKKLQKIIKEELEMSNMGSEMGYSGPKQGQNKRDLEHDQEGDMAKSQLFNIAKYALAMQKALDDDQELEAWVQSKITIAQEYLGKVKHYLEYELQLEMPEPSMGDINKIMEKEEPEDFEKKNYAGQGKFFYEV